VSVFASTAIDFIVKPFDAERFGAALDVATSEIARVRTGLEIGERSSERGRHFLQRLAVETDEKICARENR